MADIAAPQEDNGLSAAERAATSLRASHDRRFPDCDDRDLTTRQDGAKTVVYCQTCQMVVAKPDLGGEA